MTIFGRALEWRLRRQRSEWAAHWAVIELAAIALVLLLARRAL